MSREIVQKNNVPVKIDGIARRASFTHTTTEGQGMANSSGYEYDVYLSFRGKDTRTSFTDFLYTSMIDAGIRVYKDDEELGKGKYFAPELLRAINQSKISIPIFSKRYASSTWCLNELVQMVECQKTRGQKIMPIFYDVARSEVRYQIGGYGEAFLTHENNKRYCKETIREWKATLTTIGELDGWDLQKMPNRKDGEMAKIVTQKVFNELKKDFLVVSNNLVGVDSHVDKIMEEIGAHINETRIIGIHGMGGIGKTTIAKIIYNELSNKYDKCCFLSNIHETSKLKGIEYLQQQLIHDILKTKWVKIRNIDEGIKTIKERLPNKKVLLLLDDVEEKDHMDALVGKRDWFGQGSKIIITSRRKDVLEVPEVDYFYEFTSMDPNQTLQLFSRHAFRRDYPPDTTTEGQGMANSLGYEYEVFLSFRGEDTRTSFTDFLYTSMIDAGIRVYKDDEELRKGEDFGPELLQAINQSNISIPIFSKGYASSVWCLKELVQMVKCQKTRGQKIMPIFYDVARSEVRSQIGGYGEAFLTHENKLRYDEETMHEWKATLTTVGELEGWDLQNMASRKEGEMAKIVTQKVFNELKKAFLVVSNNLVGVDSHVDKIMEEIGAHINETRIIGIHGMGGIGKTTIAKIIYNELSNKYDKCCFLSNIHETSKLKGIEYLQQQLIHDILKTKWVKIRNIDEGIKTIKERLPNRKVLLLLDDVEEKDHMDALVGKRDWFGQGSKIIITSRRKDVLEVPEVDYFYEFTDMDPDQSLQLFSRHAFRRDYPPDDYLNQSKKAIEIAGGLPLAIEVIGSLLSGTEKKMWDVKLEMLANVPHDHIQRKLKISYDALDDGEKCIFLDIACFFVGYDKDTVVHFWEASKFFPKVAMEVLQNMSLIKITEDNRVWMHDQLRDLGREVVRQECKIKIEKQSRVWNPEEALDLLSTHKEKTKVEALCLKCDHQHQYGFTFEDFKRLPNLRFLEVDGWTENSNSKRRRPFSKTNVFQENSLLLPQLQWLSWHDIPPTVNITNFSMENIVIVDLSFGKFTHDWDGWSHMEVIKNLKVLNLTNCWYLERTPNFSTHASLECLILRGCSKLVEIDRSICRLKQLGCLDLTYCSDLQRLPDEIGGLEALKELRIDWTPIEEIPNCQGMRNLRIFTASGCRITTLPLSIGDLASLQYVCLKECRRLEGLPDSIGYCESLIELDITWTKIKELPDSMGRLKNLKLMKMTGSYISNIPDTLWTVEKLEEITAADNWYLHLKIDNCIYKNQSLRILRLKCAEICTIPRLPESLTNLYLSKLNMMTFPNLSNLINLKELDLTFGPRHHDVKSYGHVGDLMPWWIGKLSKLQYLRLECDYVIALPTDINLLPQLKTLDLHCSNLSCLPRLPSSLSSLYVNDCMSLCLMDLSNLKKLSSLMICSSPISEMRGLGCLGNLKILRIFHLGQVEMLPDLSDLNELRSLEVRNCGNLVEIQGELSQSLKELEICSCESLQKLPHLSSLKRLQKIVIEDCMKLNVEAILGIAQRSEANLWENLQNLQISDLQQVEKLPDLSNLNKLSCLDVRSCGNLMEIQGKLPQSLEEFGVYSCESLRRLPDLSSLNQLQRIDINDCTKLNVEAILGSAPRNRKRGAPWS